MPRAEKKSVGAGLRVGMVEGQVSGVVEMRRLSFDGVGVGRVGVRRAWAWMVVIWGCERRVARI